LNARIPLNPLQPDRVDLSVLLSGAPDAGLSGQGESPRVATLTYVSDVANLTHMEKTQVYLRKEELDALRKAAARSGRSIADLIRDAIRKVVLKPEATGPVAIWDGVPKHSSVDHDSVHDEP
jgi:Ribbon-helix-helix protein, copG family